jgi:exopolyphosphatase/guanosine-5'-triphosphate,3'-diphosphate pyrophosphatase
MIIRKIGAMDFGSNAVRGVIAEYSPFGLNIIKKHRYPVRLGEEVFHDRLVSEAKIQQLVEVVQAFKAECLRLGVSQLRAVGTSALREASNQKTVLKTLWNECELKLEILSGSEEAQLIWLAVKNAVHLENHCSVLMDIGGGSIELTYHHHQEPPKHQSFDCGTLRLLEAASQEATSAKKMHTLVRELCEKSMRTWLKKTARSPVEFVVGTGGNLTTLYELIAQFFPQHNLERPIATRREIRLLLLQLEKYTVKQRQKIFSLRKDRADVIVPAIHLLLLLMELLEVDEVLLPKTGLREGVLWSMVLES